MVAKPHRVSAFHSFLTEKNDQIHKVDVGEGGIVVNTKLGYLFIMEDHRCYSLLPINNLKDQAGTLVTQLGICGGSLSSKETVVKDKLSMYHTPSELTVAVLTAHGYLYIWRKKYSYLTTSQFGHWQFPDVKQFCLSTEYFLLLSLTHLVFQVKLSDIDRRDIPTHRKKNKDVFSVHSLPAEMAPVHSIPRALAVYCNPNGADNFVIQYDILAPFLDYFWDREAPTLYKDLEKFCDNSDNDFYKNVYVDGQSYHALFISYKR